MIWGLIFTVWIFYPLAATAVIIALWIVNREYKKRIRENEEQIRNLHALWQQGQPVPPVQPPVMRSEQMQQEQKQAMRPEQLFQQDQIMHSEHQTPPRQAQQPRQQQQQAQQQFRPQPPGQEIPQKAHDKKAAAIYPGTAALIIGVILVVLAGLVFATTTWKILPDISKVILVLALALFFFAASCIAEKRLKIERTGRAFYVLGSIFLFLTILAVGYFKLLGPGFVLEGRNRWWVLWTGSLVTECAFLIGFRNYKEKIYTIVYLGGLTVSMSFLMAALSGAGIGFAKGMICYSFALLLCDWLNRSVNGRRGKGFLPQQAERVWSGFSIVHFLVFCTALMPGVLLGFLSEMGGSWLGQYQITVWDIFCLGIAVAGMRMAAARWSSYPVLTVLYSILVAVFFQYAGWGIPVEMEYRALAAGLMAAAWYTVNKRNWNPWRTEQEESAAMVSLVLNSVALFTTAIWSVNHVNIQIAAALAVLATVAVAVQWSEEEPNARRTYPYLLTALAITGSGVCCGLGITWIHWDWAALVVLILFAAWDLRRKDSFRYDILILGTILQIVSWQPGTFAPPFFLLLTLYIFEISGKEEERKKIWMRRGSSLYSLVFLYLELYGRLSNRLSEVLAVLLLLMLEYVIAIRLDRSLEKDPCWDIAGSLTFLLLMCQFYLGGDAGIGYLAGCILVFLILYSKIYLGNVPFAGLPMVFIILPLPWFMAVCGGYSSNQIYVSTALAIVISGLLRTVLGPVCQLSEDGKKLVRIDWFQMLAWILLVPMAAAGSRGWRFTYTLLLIPYLLQFLSFPKLRRWVLTAAMAVGVMAWWIQPVFPVSERVALFMALLPVALFAAGLPYIWGKDRVIRNLQTGIGIFCLLMLMGAALISSDVWDALILEAVCLMIFVAAYMTGYKLWIRICGTVIVLMALYMTKGFWLSLSWWVYLLAAGAGLIGFAAWNEGRNKDKK